jgi:hypothetical protein
VDDQFGGGAAGEGGCGAAGGAAAGAGESPTYGEILNRLAPCGLDCRRCVMRAGGVIQQAAQELAAALEGFENMAARVAERVPALGGYRQFDEVLRLMAGASCVGCREGGATFPFCAARTCFREQAVDYCFQCGEYPCGRNQFPENFEQRWRENNERMRAVGVERYYRESLLKPRYE